MPVVELAALPGTGKSTLYRRVLNLADERGMETRLPAPREVSRAYLCTRWRRPRYWSRVNTMFARSVDRGARTQRPINEHTKRLAHYWDRESRVRAGRKSSLPVLFEEGPLHELWRLSHWLNHEYRTDVLSLARHAAISPVLVVLEVDVETALARVQRKASKGPINRALARAHASDAVWAKGHEVYEALMEVAERRRGVEVVRLSTRSRVDTARAVEHVWALMAL